MGPKIDTMLTAWVELRDGLWGSRQAQPRLGYGKFSDSNLTHFASFHFRPMAQRSYLVKSAVVRV